MKKYTEYQKDKLKIANIIFLVYDVTDQKTFEELEKWFKLIKESCQEKLVLSILANKIDDK